MFYSSSPAEPFKMAEKRKSQISLFEFFQRKKGKTDEDTIKENEAEMSKTPPYEVGASIVMDIGHNSERESDAEPGPEVSLHGDEQMEANSSTLPGQESQEGCSEKSPQPQRSLLMDIKEGAAAMKTKQPLDDPQKKYFIDNRKPSQNFNFPGRQYEDKRKPSNKMTRRCCLGWFDEFDFISYSEKDDGLYCLSCVLFPMPAHQGKRAEGMITSPYRNWKNARDDLKNHSTLQYHQDSNARLKAFMSAQMAPHSRVNQMLSSDASATISKNRRFLESITRCVEHCGRQGIALRGHRDDGNPLEADDEERNFGNFKALVKLVSRTDDGLREHLENCKKNASYTSKTTQNDLLDCIREYIQEKIVDKVKSQTSGPYFSIIADEVTDCSNWEQLGVIVRYLEEDEPVERLIEYVNCRNIEGGTIADMIIKCLTDVGLDLDKCRCQTYDGAGNMAGKQKGAAAQFRSKTRNEKATYFHCASHELNLALSKASSVAEVHNMVCLMQSVGLFFKFSAKRQRAFEVSIEQVCSKRGDNPKILKHKLKPLCETRWVERHTAFDDLKTLYEPLLDCLDLIESNDTQRWDPKTVTEASGLNAQLRSSKFLVAFTVCHYIFGFTKGLSRQLQGTAMDIVRAYAEVDNITKELEGIRRQCDDEFSGLYAESEAMAEVAQTPIVKPRLVGRQTLRTNVPAETAEEYFKRAIFLPFLDGLTTQLKDRFKGRASDAIQAMYLIPSNLHKIPNHAIDTVIDYYKDDLPFPGDIRQELRLWNSKWSSCANQDLPTSLTDTLKTIKEEGVEKIYPNVATIMRILLTFSATSAAVERTNSALRFIKNTYRSTMTEDRFNALVLMFVHRDIALDYNQIIDKYARKYPRRMLFKNPLVL